MTEKAYRPGEAYAYPLILKKLLGTALAYSPEREIVYRDRTRVTYRTLHERIGRLADGLARLGVAPGDVVAAMEFDSHRYLECFFAVPGMGAIAADRQLAALARADRLHAQPRRGEGRARQCAFPARCCRPCATS